MKTIYRKFVGFVALTALILGMSSCKDADPEFVHDNVLLTDVRLKTTPGAEGIKGVITEYDAQGNVVPADQVTVKAVEGGYGTVVFELPLSLKGTYDLESCYLGTSLTLSQIVSPGLGGLKNIINRDADGKAQGIWVTVSSGAKTTRQYNIVGYFNGEYILTDND